MPSPNAVPKSSAKKAADKKGADLAPTLAKRRSQDFKSKIAEWDNTAGSAAEDEVVVVVADDDEAVIVVEEETIKIETEKDITTNTDAKTPATPKANVKATPKSGAKSGEKKAEQRKTSREVDLSKQAWVRRKSKAAVEVPEEVKEATTPKKRVISDGHWRRDRAKKDEQSPEKEPEKPKVITPKPVTIKRSVASVGLKSSPATLDVEVRETETKRITRVARRSGSRERVDSKEGTPDYETSGTKVYVKRRRRSREHDNAEKTGKGVGAASSSFTATSSFDKTSSGTEITTPDLSPSKALTPRPSTAPRERLTNRLASDVPMRKRSVDAEDMPRRVSRGKAAKEQDDPVKERISASRPLPAPPGVFGTRIQGWLAEMPEDPFTAPSEPSIASDQPRRKSKRYTYTDDEYDTGRRRSSGKSKRSRPSAESRYDDDEPRTPRGWNSVGDWVDDSTPTGLKRSGARRSTYSPVKDKSMRGVSGTTTDDPPRPRIPNTTIRRFTYNETNARSYDDSRRRLPAIASDETLASRALPRNEQLSIIDDSTLSRASDGDEPTHRSHGLKRRLTKHSDLMSVLSQSRDNGKGVGRTRTRRQRSHSVSIADLMNELSTDELKYQRELRTLVDGVIPVLLTYVISKSDAAKVPGSRKTSLHDNPTLTQPIYDMGVSLERLKNSHKRIPMHDPNELLLWAESTARQYSEYLRAWRLGFEDIVVNLAPAKESDAKDDSKWDDGLQRNRDGDLVGGDGERVDVEYLLKRPLVRIKNIGKTLQSISQIKPSALADDMTALYQGLVLEAKRRSNDERARLEDEAAAAIDATRARDPRNLVQLAGVHIDMSRSVRARDYFDMELIHSSGQQLGRTVELIRRDNPLSVPGPGDVLFCEVSSTGRWLLFPPILASYVTARKGSRVGEIVVMIRGFLPGGSEWRELMSLQSSEEQSQEWVQMLGSNPMPPKLPRQSSFNTLRLPSIAQQQRQERPPSPTESVVPFGERASSSAPKWDGSQVNSRSAYPSDGRASPSKRYYANNAIQSSSQDNEVRSRYRHTRSRTEGAMGQKPSGGHKDYNVWLPSSDREEEESADEDDRPARRPTLHRRTSSVPSQDMPTIAKLRKTSPQDNTPARKASAEEPVSAPSKLQKKTEPPLQNTKEPFTPTKSRPTSLGLRSGALPSFTPAFMKRHRRSSSPLKHEYEPSTATESSSDSELSDIDDDESVTSNSTVEEGEAISTIGELKDFSHGLKTRTASNNAPSRRSSQSVDQESLRPSDSPSQGPYRGVPPSTSGSAKSIACILAWNNNSGSWNSLHPEECEIVVTPGLVEAFDLAQAHAVANKGDDLEGPSPSAYGVKPLVALELTPLVPIRQGTALDISVTSPPTANSVLRGSTNIMFRSRNPEECAKLYSMINRARIDNPTWIALQNARGPQPTSNWAAVMDQRNAARADASPGWMKSLSRKASSYRSKGPRSASIAASQSSVGTMNTVSSALRKFGGGSRFFNIGKSTIVSRDGTKSSGSDSLDSGAATPVPIDLRMGTPIGMTNTKCRLYNREDSSRWRDMGAARLTIMHPPRPASSGPADPNTVGLLKRVLVVGKSRGETLLDVTLEERCFERVGRTGIAVTIWSELIGPNGELGHAAATGGVGSSQTRMFMLQMKSEREAAYTFNMVGKLRY